jgi:hypothetical protein
LEEDVEIEVIVDVDADVEEVAEEARRVIRTSGSLLPSLDASLRMEK